MSNDLVVIQIDKARVALAEAVTIQETKKYVDMGKTFEDFTRKQKLSKEVQDYAHRFQIEALEQLGRMLIEMPKNTGAAGIGRAESAVPKEYRTQSPTLADIGLTKKESALAQNIALLSPAAPVVSKWSHG